MSRGGRLFYMGAGTSGRLGIVDASECPPTYGVEHGLVVGIIAGGDSAIRKAVEFAEDDTLQGFQDLEAYSVNENDVVVGISASGRTPYVLGALNACREKGIATGCIVCNPGSVIAAACNAPVEVVTGPEFVTGSTRMKAGTATKMVLNMITTSVMIRLGRVVGNKMVDMQLSNDKLIERGTRMVMQSTGLSEASSRELLLKYGSVRKAVEAATP
jgi:N-acetylmuramic acid 6-phosphate etherase